ncbi:efflux RND transporter periplasmic adaptor subunit [Pseudomonas sp. SDO524_S393]
MKPFQKHPGTVLAAAIGLLVAGGVFLSSESHVHAEAASGLPVVTYQSAIQHAVADTQDYTGRLEAVDLVDIRSRVPGTLLAVQFKSGQHVRKGDLLFTIDPAPYEAKMRQAQARMLAVAERQRLAQTEQARGRRLLESNSIARKDFDVLDNAARVAAATLSAAQAEFAHAQLQLGYTQVRAPITGRVSRAEITEGNVIGAGGESAPLTRIVSDDKLYASFNVDEQSYLSLIAPSLRAAAQPRISVGLANDSAFPYAATLEALDNQMDTRSGTVRVRALISHPSAQMLPGLQARVRVQAGVTYEAVKVDDAVIGTDQDRRYVLIVNAQNKVERRFVELGAVQGRERILLKGIEPGTRIIIDGAFRAPPGTEVEATPAKTADASVSSLGGDRP